MTIEHTNQEQPEELLSLEAAAEFLCVSKPTLYRMLDRGEVKGIKVGRQWRFKKSDLDAYLTRGPVAMALATVPMALLDAELDFFAEELRKCGSTPPELVENDDDPYEQKMALIVASIAKLTRVRRISDVHLEPIWEHGKEHLLLRLRDDGLLHETRHFPAQLTHPLMLQWKKMSGMDIQEQKLPQSGRMQFAFGEEEIALRVSTVPTVFGETFHGRYVPTKAPSLEMFDLTEPYLAKLRQWCNYHAGVVLLTGPHGWNNVSIMSACLHEINQAWGAGVRMYAIGDPLDYIQPLVTAVQADHSVGFTVNNALQAVMTQDPDVIAINEMRNSPELAVNAFNAADMGHLFFSTMKAKSALNALDRLVDWKVDRVLLATMLTGIMNHRIVSKLCPECRKIGDYPTPVLEQIRRNAAAGGYLVPDDARFYQPVGCEACHNRGYTGRYWIMEFLEFTPALKQAFLAGVSLEELAILAVKEGMRTLYAEGIARATEGETSIEEIVRVIG